MLKSHDKLDNLVKPHDKLGKVVYISNDYNREEIQKILQYCRDKNIDFELVPDKLGAYPSDLDYFELPKKAELKQNPVDTTANKIVKRSFDFIFSLAVILILFPILIPIIALIIKWESNGPIFFVQRRTGLKGKSFLCLKFRTMEVNKEADTKQASHFDSRVTKFGSFLRRSSLDEIPQFINVLLGQMSVVGPRPHMIKHTIEYSNLIPNFMLRHQVKPGITGLAQIEGWRGPTDELYKMEGRVKKDIQYIENWNIGLDIKCVLKTIANVFKKEENAI